MQDKSKNILAVLFGLMLTASLLVIGEYFFRLNKTYGWLEPLNIGGASATFTTDANLDYLKDIAPPSPYPYPEDQNDYTEAYRFPECVREQMRPYWAGAKNCRPHVVMKKRNYPFIVSDTHYGFDEYARRRIPDADKKSENFFLFLGCSFTWGESVSDEETFANLVVKKFKSTNGYNLAMGGYGPNTTLQLLEQSDYRLEGIHGKKGVAIYTFIDHHIGRLLGSMSVPRTDEFPDYQIRQGELVNLGNFEDTRPFTQFFFHFLSQSELLKYFQIDFPITADRGTSLFVAVNREIKNKLRDRFGIERYIVAIYPEHTKHHKSLVSKLEEAGIEVIDLSGVQISQLTKGGAYLPGDGHPSALGHRVYSDLLVSELKKRRVFE